MKNQSISNENILLTINLEQIATDVAGIITERLSAKHILKLFHIVLLEVSEAAELLRVKPKTVYTWVSQNKIPMRYAGGKPVFLLSELLHWTLPEDDKHSAHRLSVANSSKIAVNRLATNRERRVPDVG
jgi:excisionase family DNA binding protein